MGNFELQADEVILYEGTAASNNYKGQLKITLTSSKLVIEQLKGMFKTSYILLDTIGLDTIKMHQDSLQVKQKGTKIEIQTTSQNLSFDLHGIWEANKFVGKITNAATGTTLAQRSANKIKGALDMVDDTLGLDTRGVAKSVLEQGLKGTILNGITRKK